MGDGDALSRIVTKKDVTVSVCDTNLEYGVRRCGLDVGVDSRLFGTLLPFRRGSTKEATSVTLRLVWLRMAIP